MFWECSCNAFAIFLHASGGPTWYVNECLRGAHFSQINTRGVNETDHIRWAFGPSACQDPVSQTCCLAVQLSLFLTVLGSPSAQKLRDVGYPKSPWRPRGAPRLD